MTTPPPPPAPDAAQALASLAVPVLLLAGDGRVLGGNPAGLEMLDHHPAFVTEAGILRLRRLSDRRGLRQALAALVGGREAEMLRLPSRAGTAGLLLMLRRLPAEPMQVLATPIDLRAPPQPDAAWVARAFGLPRDQARAVALLAVGLDMAEIAERLGCREAGVLDRLDRALARTGARSLTDLALMVSRAFGMLRPPAAEP